MGVIHRYLATQLIFEAPTPKVNEVFNKEIYERYLFIYLLNIFIQGNAFSYNAVFQCSPIGHRYNVHTIIVFFLSFFYTIYKI